MDERTVSRDQWEDLKLQVPNDLHVIAEPDGPRNTKLRALGERPTFSSNFIWVFTVKVSFRISFLEQCVALNINMVFANSMNKNN